MREQIEVLLGQARGYLMLAKALGKNGNICSMKAYLKSSKVCCEKVVELEKQWELDKTDIFEFKKAV